MEDEKRLQEAKAVFDTICGAFDKLELFYEKDESDLTITCGVKGEDLPVKITFKVSPEKKCLYIISFMPLTVPEDKRLDVAVAVSHINNLLVNGCFDYNIKTGDVHFRMNASYLDSTLSEDIFRYMILCAVTTVDEYNDKLLMLSKGLLSLEQFIKSADE